MVAGSLLSVAVMTPVAAWGTTLAGRVPPQPSARVARRASLSTLNFARLGALREYRARLDDNGFVSTFRVHSPTDWEVFVRTPTPLSINVSGSSYSRVPRVTNGAVSYSWSRTGPAQSYSLVTPYPGYVRQFIGLTHVAGVKLVRGGACRQAGWSGHWWGFAAAARGAVFPHVSACVADRTGWLLNSGTAALTPGGEPSHFVANFEITGVNDVAYIAVPHG